jgi:hypothetical protein
LVSPLVSFDLPKPKQGGAPFVSKMLRQHGEKTGGFALTREAKRLASKASEGNGGLAGI